MANSVTEPLKATSGVQPANDVGPGYNAGHNVSAANDASSGHPWHWLLIFIAALTTWSSLFVYEADIGFSLRLMPSRYQLVVLVPGLAAFAVSLAGCYQFTTQCYDRVVRRFRSRAQGVRTEDA